MCNFAFITTAMEYSSYILPMILLVAVNIDYGLSLSCYECPICPEPFNASSLLVINSSDCNWCAKVYLKNFNTTLRACAPKCNFDYWGKQYISISYYCCQTDYCNQSVQTCSTHQILLMIVITLICFFINKSVTK
ncbi:unnamed protein product [Schistosoma turkestanicum]|nr:unnamed protein product [Schistosoma turkestanicum]